MALICGICQKKIRLLSRIWASKCSDCGVDLHLTCGIPTLEYEAYLDNTIKHRTRCDVCAEVNSNKFGDNRYCTECKQDISVQYAQAKCEVCGVIGHNSCFRAQAKQIGREDFEYIYPYKHKYSSHKYLCVQCCSETKKKVDEVKSGLQEWVRGTKGEYVSGYRIVNELGRVEYDEDNCGDPSEVEDILKIRSVQLGGNAFVKFFWKKNSETTSYQVFDGYGPNGRRHFHTELHVEEWFTGYAYAVKVSRQPKFSGEME